jgi:polysaccharide biosynthesis transport protein
MEEEIDLRQYVEVLFRRWHWIVGLTLVAVLAAALFSFLLLEPFYTATALVLITGPRYQLQFDPRVETIEEIDRAYEAYPRLALSDDLLNQVLEALDPPLPLGERSLRSLRGKLDANAGADPSLLELTVTNGDPDRAGQIANTWAEQYVGYIDGLFSRREEDAAFFGQQLEAARVTLQAAEDGLIQFQARNQANILSAKLTSMRQAQTDYLADQRAIARIVQDVQGLHTQLSGQPADGLSSLADDLTALFLEIKAFNAQSGASIQLQVSGPESLSGKTVAEQITFLDDLIVNLEARSALIDEQVGELEPQILSLQQAVEQNNTEHQRLTRDRDVAQQTYMTLANKVEEARIAAQDEASEVRLASHAAVPIRPAGPRRMMNLAVAGFLGLFVGVLAAFVVDYWQSPRAITVEPGTRGVAKERVA